MNEYENEQTNDDQIVEITDLDPIEKPSRFTRMFEALEKHPSLRKRFWRYAIASCSVLLIVLVLFGAFPSIRGVPSGLLSRIVPFQSTTFITPTPTPADSYAFNPEEEIIWTHGNTSSFIPDATLGPAPRDCPAISQTHPFGYRGAPRVAGSSPVLVIGFGGPDAVITNFKHAQSPEIGWSKRIVLLTQSNFAGTVTLRGGEMHHGTPIWFGMKPHNQGPITTFTIQTLTSSVSNHTGSDEEWGLSTATMYIARAGCYFLIATWPEGGWIVYFSAGQ